MRRTQNFDMISRFHTTRFIVSRNLTAIATLTSSLTMIGFTAAESVVVTDWQPRSKLPLTELEGAAPYCTGGFIAQPIDVNGRDRIYFDRSDSNLNSDDTIKFDGNVKINSPGVYAEGDKAQYQRSNKVGDLDGNVVVRIPEASFSGPHATINLENYYAIIKQAQFVLHDQDIYGSAKQLERQDQQIFVAKNLVFTRCEPSSKAWRIKSTKLTINNETDTATAWNSRIEIQNIPVMYVPYLSFPLNDQPRTGLLTPTFGNGISVPYYIHLAPNYDDTITLDYDTTEGVLARNEFRFLTKQHNGINQVDYLLTETRDANSDRTSNVTNRWAVSHKQSGLLAGFGYDFSTRWVSDQNFDIAFNPGSTTVIDNQTLNLALKRNVLGFNNSLSWQYRQPVTDSTETMASLTTQFVARRGKLTLSALTQRQEEFEPSEKPASLGDFDLLKKPELQASYRNQSLPLGLTASETLKYTQFERDLTDERINALSGASLNRATVADRWHASINLNRQFKDDWWYFTPTIEGYASQYQLSNDIGYDLEGAYGDTDFTQLAWRGSLDQGLILTSTQNQWRHTLKPRLYYAYAPLIEQDAPIQEGEFVSDFKLFTTSRFTSTDRIADMQRLSTSLTYELKENEDLRFRVSALKGMKLSEEQMQLAGNGLTKTVTQDNWETEYSDWMANAKLIPNDLLTFSANVSFDHNWRALNAYGTSVLVSPGDNRFASLSFNKYDGTKNEDKSNEVEGVYENIKLGAYFPVRQNIALIGYGKAESFTPDSDFEDQTLKTTSWNDLRINEVLVGVDIDACCWNVRLAMMNIASDDDSNEQSLFPVDTKRKYFFEFTLKGIGAGSGNIESILQRLDFGYDGRLFNYR